MTYFGFNIRSNIRGFSMGFSSNNCCRTNCFDNKLITNVQYYDICKHIIKVITDNNSDEVKVTILPNHLMGQPFEI